MTNTTANIESVEYDAFGHGYACAQEHCSRGVYLPGSNPVPLGTGERHAWNDGYEEGWEAAFFAKRQPKTHAGELPLSR